MHYRVAKGDKGDSTDGAEPCGSSLSPGVGPGTSAATLGDDNVNNGQPLATPSWDLPEGVQGRYHKCDNRQWGVIQDFVQEGLKDVEDKVARQACKTVSATKIVKPNVGSHMKSALPSTTNCS